MSSSYYNYTTNDTGSPLDYSSSYYETYASSPEAAKERAGLGAYLLGLLVALVPLAIGRYAIRLQIYGRIFEDDVAFLLAFASTIAFAGSSYTYDVASMYGYSYEGNSTSLDKYVAPLNCLFFFGLSATRFSVLFLYRDLFWVSVTFRRYWKLTFTWLVLATIVMMGLSIATVNGVDTYTRGSSYSASAESLEEASAKPMICTYFNIISTLLIVAPPLWIFPSLHLRHSLNWTIGLIYCLGLGGFSVAIINGTFSGAYESSSSNWFGSWALYWETIAAGMLAYTPLLLPDQRQQLWPWSLKAGRAKDAEQQKSTSTEDLMDRKPRRKGTYESITSLIHRSSTGSSDNIEMNDFRSSLEDIRLHKVLPYDHVQGRGMDMNN